MPELLGGASGPMSGASEDGTALWRAGVVFPGETLDVKRGGSLTWMVGLSRVKGGPKCVTLGSL